MKSSHSNTHDSSVIAFQPCAKDHMNAQTRGEYTISHLLVHVVVFMDYLQETSNTKPVRKL